MRTFYIGILLLPLFACAEGMQPIDARKFLASLESPRTATVEDSLVEAARIAEKQEDFARAAQIYQQVLEKQPDNKTVQLALADNYRRSGDQDQAIALYDALITQDAQWTAPKEGKGLALLAKGDFDAPAALFEEVMSREPTRWKTLNALGILFTTRNMHTEAQQYFQEALKFSPSNPSVLNNLGLSQAFERNYTAAFQNLILASGYASGGERRRIDLNLALAYATSGRLSDARAIASRYYSGAELNNNLGVYAHLAKNDALARDYLNMALTESKVFYEKAWGNLQAVNAAIAADTPQVKEKAKPPARKPKPKSRPKPKAEPKPEPKPEPKEEPKQEAPDPGPKPEPKPEPKPKKSRTDERLSDIINADD